MFVYSDQQRLCLVGRQLAMDDWELGHGHGEMPVKRWWADA